MATWNVSFKHKRHLDNLKKTCTWCYTVWRELGAGETDEDVWVRLDFFYDGKHCLIKSPDDYDDTKDKPDYPEYSRDPTNTKANFDRLMKKGEKSVTICLIVECEGDCETAENEHMDSVSFETKKGGGAFAPTNLKGGGMSKNLPGPVLS
jgi:hypothetical protein